MKREIIIVGVIAVVGVNLSGCGLSERVELTGKNETNLSREKPNPIGMPNPAAVYCKALGYKYKIVTDDEGNQRGICIFPDNSACPAWNFYRGKCGQEWSYCAQQGYDLKDLGRYEGWVRGAVCIDKNTKEEAGTVFDLMDMDLSRSLPER